MIVAHCPGRLTAYLPGDQDVSKAPLNAVEAEERVLDDPEDPTDETTARIGLYAHTLVRTGLPLVSDRGAKLLVTPASFATVVL